MKKRVIAAVAALMAIMTLVSCKAAIPPVETPPVEPSPVETTPPAPPVTSTPSVSSEIAAPEGIKRELAELWGKIDGSTATIPLTAALYDFLNGGGDWPPVHNTTSSAYYHLMFKSADLIFVTYPSENEFTEARNNGIEFEIIPVTKDALVFLVNIDNPVDHITLSQLRNIYAGKITNWKQLGGLDEEIIPYQRTANSGSQTLFLKLLMEGAEPVTPPTEWIAETMGALVESVSGYDNARNAIGYSMFYYVNNMYGNSQFKLLTIDGVKPSRDTITRGEYALEDFYYAVMRKDMPIDAPARKLVDWVLTDDGQILAVQAGYIPLRPIAGAEPVTEIDPVYLGDTDNSSGTGGTALKTGDEITDAVNENVRKPLSDMFYDGFNYIRHINTEIMNQLDEVDREFFDRTWADWTLIRPFTGIPNDYPNYKLEQAGYMRIDFPENNPFFKHAMSFSIRLTADISPYGTQAANHSVTYEDAGMLLPKVKLFTLDVSIPKSPEISARINERLREWEAGFAKNREAVETLDAFHEYWSKMIGYPEYTIRLQPSTDLWRDYLSVYYQIATYDGPSSYNPVVYNICFDINTGEIVDLASLLPIDEIDFSKAWIMTPWYYKDGEMADGEMMGGGMDEEVYIPKKGSIVTKAWSDSGFYITEPDGRVLLVNYWEGIE